MKKKKEASRQSILALVVDNILDLLIYIYIYIYIERERERERERDCFLISWHIIMNVFKVAGARDFPLFKDDSILHCRYEVA